MINLENEVGETAEQVKHAVAETVDKVGHAATEALHKGDHALTDIARKAKGLAGETVDKDKSVDKSKDVGDKVGGKRHEISHAAGGALPTTGDRSATWSIRSKGRAKRTAVIDEARLALSSGFACLSNAALSVRCH